MTLLLIILTILITTLSTVYYIVTIFRGQTKPHIYSWFIWALIQIIACIIQFQHGAQWWSLTLGFNGLTCVLVTFLALWYGEKHITRLDTISFLVALCILPIWLWAKQDLIAMMLSLSIDVLSYIPTLRKSFQKPHEESLSPYIASSMGFIFSFFLLKEINFINTLYPLVIICINFFTIGYLIWRRWVTKK